MSAARDEGTAVGLSPATQKEERLLAAITKHGLTVVRVGPNRAVRVFGPGVDIRAVTLGTLQFDDLRPARGRHGR